MADAAWVESVIACHEWELARFDELECGGSWGDEEVAGSAADWAGLEAQFPAWVQAGWGAPGPGEESRTRGWVPSGAEQVAVVSGFVDWLRLVAPDANDPLAGAWGASAAEAEASDAERVDVLSALESLKGAIGAAQARVTLAFVASQQAEREQRGLSTRSARRGLCGSPRIVEVVS